MTSSAAAARRHSINVFTFDASDIAAYNTGPCRISPVAAPSLQLMYRSNPRKLLAAMLALWLLVSVVAFVSMAALGGVAARDQYVLLILLSIGLASVFLPVYIWTLLVLYWSNKRVRASLSEVQVEARRDADPELVHEHVEDSGLV